MTLSSYIIPCFIGIVIIVGVFKDVPIYNSFVEGAKESLQLIFSIFPYLCAILIAVELFALSGLSAKIANILSPVFDLLGIPSELCQLLVVRPLSGNGSIAMLESIYAEYGADSYISRCASVIVGSSETVFYIASVYFSTIKVKKMRYAVTVSLISTYIGVFTSCLLCRIM